MIPALTSLYLEQVEGEDYELATRARIDSGVIRIYLKVWEESSQDKDSLYFSLLAIQYIASRPWYRMI